MRFKPHEYQGITIDHFIQNRRAGGFLRMGLGKTVSSLTAVRLLLGVDISRALIVAPLRVARDTWPNEIRKWDHLADLTYACVLGTETQRLKALAEDVDIYLINRENIPWLVQNIRKAPRFDMIVVDESSSFKSPKAKRFRAMRKLTALADRVVILTGTPAPNGLMDLWAQAYLLDQGERLGKTITSYRDRFFHSRSMGQFSLYSPKRGAEDDVYQRLSDICIGMNTEDWLDLPPLTEVDYEVILSDKTIKTYKKFEKDYIMEISDGTHITAANAAVLAGKLLQLSSGVIYTENGRQEVIHCDKLDAMEDIIEAANGRPVMVFYRFKHSLDAIRRRFPHAKTLDECGQDAWNSNEVPILCLHPQSAGHGLNLQESDCQTEVWYDITWSLEEYEQAVARVYRQGLKSALTVYRLVAKSTMDEVVISALRQKEISQNVLMECVRVTMGGYQK